MSSLSSYNGERIVGSIEKVKIDPSLWPPGSFQDLDAFVQSRLTSTHYELFHLMQTLDEDVLLDR